MSLLGFRTSTATRCSRNLYLFRGTRLNSSAASPGNDLRKAIMDEIKIAMKTKDTSTSTTLRSVLSEVYNADKMSNDKINSSAIAIILRKAVERRNEAAVKFAAAAREELAEKELKEAGIMAKFLPPLLSEEKVDSILGSILETLPQTEGPQHRALGVVFKQFYAQVDKSTVDAEMVKRRARALIASRS
ncbi:GatB/YqeY domain-containing protein [Coprinopsis marcescibilis]|uniref:Altered inheritance of mitochondria protein 41 n=1 Tax=Coprinopsis marcescibilis TaxID=230819 RepID=A0A5C3KYX4_COPMA|nr:GatB/YqeY domain-containing protein [Coprinopsis marcescibilis]